MQNKYLFWSGLAALVVVTVGTVAGITYWYNARVQVADQGSEQNTSTRSAEATTSEAGSVGGNPYENNSDYALYEGPQYSFYYPTFFDLDELVFDGSETSRDFFNRDSDGEILDSVSFNRPDWGGDGTNLVPYYTSFYTYRNSLGIGLETWLAQEYTQDPNLYPDKLMFFVEPYEIISQGSYKSDKYEYLVLTHPGFYDTGFGLLLREKSMNLIAYLEVVVARDIDGHEVIKNKFIDLLISYASTLSLQDSPVTLDSSLNNLLKTKYEQEVNNTI